MSTIQPTLKRTPTRWPAAVVTTAAALLAVAVLFLALAAGSGSHHAAISHPTATYYPLIHYRGTGAAPTPTAGARPTPASHSRHTSYGLVP